MVAFTHTLRIRYHECDAQGHVFNAHYFAFFDIAITELWRGLLRGGDQAMVDELGVHGRRGGDRAVSRIRMLDELITSTSSSRASGRRRRPRPSPSGAAGDAGGRPAASRLRRRGTLSKEPIPDALRVALEPYISA